MRIKGLGLGRVMAVVALVGCGSSSGVGGTGGSGGNGTGGNGGQGGTTGGGGAFTTSVPAGTKLTGLTTAQASQLCNDIQNYVDSIAFPALCQAGYSVSGPQAAYFNLLQNPTASNSELQAACASGVVDAGSCAGYAADGGTNSCNNISEVPSTCQATVGDYTKCINDQTAAELQVYAAVPNCSTLTAASLKDFFEVDGGPSLNAPEPASCSKVDSTCNVDGGTGSVSSIILGAGHRLPAVGDYRK